MNVKSKGKRIFGGCLLLMMAVLAVYLITFAAVSDRWDPSGSYSLVVQKEFGFGENIPEEVKEQARNQSYTFKITGTRITVEGDSKRTVEVDETITLPRKDENGDMVWVSEEYRSNGPFDVTVTEITDNIVIKDSNGNYYNMSESSSDTRVTVDTRKHEARLRNNSTLTIVRPDNDGGPERLWYHVTNRPYDDHLVSSFEDLSQTFSLKAGEEEKFKGLCAAVYTIEQIAAPDGYQIQMGERDEEVVAGKTGRFYINGTPGTLTLTAGGSKGDGITHYYTVDRTEKEDGDTSEFVVRTVPIASGESYKLDNLPRGGYTVTEYTIDASEASKVTIPETVERTVTKRSGNLSSEATNSWKYFNLEYDDFDVDYIKAVSFGPLRNSSGNKLNNKTSYNTFRYGIVNDDGKIIASTYSRDTGFTGNLTVTMSDAVKTKLNTYKRLYCSTAGVKSTTATTIDVRWIEYDEKETEKTFKRVGEPESLPVDDRKWIKIEAPPLKDPNADGADQIAYYYTLRDIDGNLITGTTDRQDTTVKLLPGDSTEMELPGAGTYTIVEAIDGNTPVGFNMKVSGRPFGTTETGKETRVKVGGERDITISKPALSIHPDNSADDREYTFSVMGSGNFYEFISVKAGESQTLTLPEEGEYKIMPQNEKMGNYELGYTDSGAVYGPAEDSTSTITFTNSFSQGEYGYRFVHEYYIREDDNTYTYVGNSQITTRLGREEDEKYQALDISQAPQFNGNTYKHFDDAYGIVDGIQSSAESQIDLSDDLENADYIVYPIASASSARVNQGSGMYPVASPSSAQAKLDDGELEALNDQEPGSDDTGIINKGVGFSSENQLLNYEPDPDWDHIKVTKDASQIVILRYYRDRQPKGKYNVIHVYYFRGENGDIWEGISGVLPQNGELGIKYTGDQVNKIYSFKPADAQQPYTYTWDSTQYGVVEKIGDTGNYNPDTDEFAGDGLIYRSNNDWIDVEGTEEGNQIIILRYYREPSKEGAYNVVHEYYFREESENHNSEEEDLQHGRAAQYLNGDTETDEGDEDIPNKFTGTINRNDGYVYTFEGRTGIESVTGKLGDTCTEEDVDKKYKYGKESYHYIEAGYGTTPDHKSYSCNPNQQWAAVTEEGKDIIILRYYRDKEPEEPASGSYNIVHEYYLEKKDGSRQLEGIRDIISQTVNPLTDQTYTADKDMEKPVFGDHTYTHDNDVYGRVISDAGDDQKLTDKQTINGTTYGRDPDMKGVQATKMGDQIIILRYVRQEPEVPEKPAAGIYKVVHTYYLRDETGDHFEGRSGITAVKADLDGRKYTSDSVVKIPVSEATHKEYGYETSAYGYAPGNTDNDTATTQDPKDTLYRAETGKTWAEATEAGDQIIILKYVRTEPKKPDKPTEPEPDTPDTPDTPTTGSYKVVHTYYLRDESGDHFEGRSGIVTVKADLDGRRYTADNVEKIPTSEATGREYGYETSAYGYAPGNMDNDTATTQDPGDTLYRAETGKTWVEAAETGDQIMILKYIRTEPSAPDDPEAPVTGSYKVVHMYYLRNNTGDHFEGRSGIGTVERTLSDATYTSEDVEKIPTCPANQRVYVYDSCAYGHVTGDIANDQPTVQDPGDTLYQADPEMEWVRATETGDQIIILKYYRRVNSGGGRPGSGSDSGTEPGPEPTEPTPETPANPVPETPPDPTPEQPSLPDPNDPDSPDRVTITEDGVPTTYVKVWDPEAGEYIYLPEGEVPLWGLFLPKTGDMSKSPLWALLAMGSLGILWTLWSRKPGNEEDR